MTVKKTIKKFFIVKNDKGLHTRPATEIVKCLAKFKSNITLQYGELTVNGKSLLGIMMLFMGLKTFPIRSRKTSYNDSNDVRYLLDVPNR